MKSIESFFSQNPLWPEVCHVLNQLKNQKFDALIVGGAVRDAWMKKIPKDFDVATNAHPDQVKKIFKHSQFVGKSFGVIHLPFKNGQHIEIATFRKDGTYIDGRRPESVEFTSIEEDAKRRDFTINALYYDFHKKKVIDFFEGIKDIEEKKIRTVGNPEVRFQEDYLRIIRALRFSVTFDFEIEEKTFKTLKNLMPQIVHLSKERVIQELDKIFSNRSVSFLKVSVLFLKTCFLQTFWNELSWENEINQKFWNFKNEKNILHWCLLFSFIVDQKSSNLKEKLKDLLKKSMLSNKKMNQILAFFNFYEEWMNPKTRIGKRLQLLHIESGQAFFDLTKHIQENVYSQKMNHEEVLNQYLHTFKQKLPSAFLSGQDLIQLKVEQGPQMSALLEVLYHEQLEGRIHSRNEAFGLLKTLKKTTSN